MVSSELHDGGQLSGVSPPTAAVTFQRNELEAMVRPDHTCLTNEALLFGTPYVVNTEYRVLICLECRHAVSPNSASSHVQSEHCQCRVSKDFNSKLSECFPQLTEDAVHPGRAVSPVFGLAIPPSMYHICKACLHGYKTPDCLRKHRKTRIQLQIAHPLLRVSPPTFKPFFAAINGGHCKFPEPSQISNTNCLLCFQGQVRTINSIIYFY